MRRSMAGLLIHCPRLHGGTPVAGLGIGNSQMRLLSPGAGTVHRACDSASGRRRQERGKAA
jgi:hypothetical protein